MESFVFVALTPLAAALMAAVGAVAWRRRDTPGGRGLAAFSGVSACWVVTDALSVLVPTPDATVLLAQMSALWGPLLGVSWFSFLLSHTERFTPAARTLVRVFVVWGLAYAILGMTNPAHGLVWSSWEAIPDGPFLTITYTLGPAGWVQSAFMWTVVSASLVVLVRAYAHEGRSRRALSWWIVVGALVPLTINMVHATSLGSITKDFTPLAMAVSSAAFALGLARYRFLDLKPVARAALIDTLGDGVLVLDTRGRVVDTNSALSRALEIAPIHPGQLLSDIADDLARAVEDQPVDPVPLATRSGIRYFDLRVSPIEGLSGEASGRLVVIRDVTRRRRERLALREANHDLHHANAELHARNEELDAFAHTVAHDLKNSTHGLLGLAEIVRDEGQLLPPDVHREITEEIVRTASRMGDVVHELLLLARVRQADIDLRPVAMRAVVEEALDRVRQSHGLDPASVDAPARWPIATGYAPWIEEVWANYLSNAIKYGGSLISVGADVRVDGDVRFWVHDDGPSLTPAEQAQLFVPFSRLRSESAEGHGLGLSIVHRIAGRLGGACGVESAPGEGNRFWFSLPSFDGGVPHPHPTHQSVAESSA